MTTEKHRLKRVVHTHTQVALCTRTRTQHGPTTYKQGGKKSQFVTTNANPPRKKLGVNWVERVTWWLRLVPTLEQIYLFTKNWFFFFWIYLSLLCVIRSNLLGRKRRRWLACFTIYLALFVQTSLPSHLLSCVSSPIELAFVQVNKPVVQ